jgi:hypothetical protein
MGHQLTPIRSVLAGAFHSWSPSVDRKHKQGVAFSGYVSAANTVTVWLENQSAATVDLGSGTLRVKVSAP